MAEFDPYRKWLGIPPKEQPPNHYRLLGVGLFESDPDVISNAADRQMVHVRSFQSGKYSELSQRILNELAAARLCLLDQEKRAQYDRRLRASLAADKPIPPPPSPPGTVSRRATPPPPRTSTPLPPDADERPSVSPMPAIPQVNTVGSPFSGTTRASAYAGRRRKNSNAQGVVITMGMVLVAVVVLLVWAMNQSRSGTPKEKQPANASSKANSSGSSHGRTNGASQETSRRVRPENGRRPMPTPVVYERDAVGLIHAFQGHTGRVGSAVFSPTGAFVFSGGEDKSVRKWDAQNGQSLLELHDATGSVLSVDVSGDGRQLLALVGGENSSSGKAVYIWQAAAGRVDQRFAIEDGQVRDAVFHPQNPAYVLLAYDSGIIRLFNLSSAEEVRQFTGHAGPVLCVAFSADGTKILSGGEDGTVRLWDRVEGTEVHSMTAHQGAVLSVAFSPQANFAISGGTDRTVRQWDLKSGKQLQVFDAHLGEVTSVACSPDGRHALSGSLDGTIRLWSLSDGREVCVVGQHKGGVRSVAFSPGGRRVLSAGDDQCARLWGLPDLSTSATPGDAPGDPQNPPVDDGPKATDRLAVPQPDAQQEVEQLIKGVVFKQDFDEADRPSKVAALIRKLLEEGGKPQQNTAAPYVLFRLARDLAVESGDSDAALQAVEEMAVQYDVDRIGEKVRTLEALAKATVSSTQKRALVEKLLVVVEEAVAADNFDAAGRLAILARASVASVRDGALAKRVTQASQEIQEFKQAYEPVRAALEVIRQQPNDPQANETVGKYYCLVKGDWEKGLTYLASGADESLKNLAESDLADAPLPSDRLAVADGWWETSEKATGRAKIQLQRRAAFWYKLIEPQLTGLDQGKARQRLAQVGDLDAPLGVVELPRFKGLECRRETLRPAMLRAFGGNDASEAAVARALEWLSRHQEAEGNWNFDHTGPRCQDRCPNKGTLDTAPNAATALALLPMLAAGNGPRDGRYQKNIALGLNFLINRIVWHDRSAASLYESDAGSMPSHALATIAFCEASTVARATRTKAAAQSAVNFIVRIQNTDGGWGVKPPLPPNGKPSVSDVISTGWNVAALRTAQWAGLNVPKKTLTQAGAYLESMRTEDKTGYRRDEKQAANKADTTATALGMLCQMYLGRPRDAPDLVDYVTTLGGSGPSTSGQFYLNYLHAELLRHHGGPVWEAWNEKLRDHLVFTQETAGHAEGSWFADNGWSSASGGRLFATVLAALTLEVYYRHPPLYR